ncbi:hypothetical protein BKA64DRAFT_160623 [Cadophora sp. MPI-SDFR-AT-0126]|nr:hypothetical protein BKA64DRAFT_160623 [Leotiomycetes sp. MPI-SDFR-AT-0126]
MSVDADIARYLLAGDALSDFIPTLGDEPLERPPTQLLDYLRWGKCDRPSCFYPLVFGARESYYYYCSACPESFSGESYRICSLCAESGKSCLNSEHMLMKRIYDEKTGKHVDDKLHTISRGLRVLVNEQMISGIGDTGSEETIISEARCLELGATILPDKKLIALANGRKMLSTGTAHVCISFPDAPKKSKTEVLARVVKNFAFDILLGRPFLTATQTMEKHLRRFVRCLFPAKNLWAFYRLGETAERFNATMRLPNQDQIPFAALPDTGSRRNVMSAQWAVRKGFDIRTEKENIGWITFPAGRDEATIGQVHTKISLPDGRLIPIVFDVLPTSRLPVVLGIDFVLDNNIYQRYADSFSKAETKKAEPDCTGMGYKPWSSSEDTTDSAESPQSSSMGSMSLSVIDDNLLLETQETTRRLKWDRQYDFGKLASADEWAEENQRRHGQLGTCHQSTDGGGGDSLIAHVPGLSNRNPILQLSYHNDNGTVPAEDDQRHSGDLEVSRCEDSSGGDGHESTQATKDRVDWEILPETALFGQFEANQWQR